MLEEYIPHEMPAATIYSYPGLDGAMGTRDYALDASNVRVLRP